MNEKLKAMREASLIEEINSNSLQMEQLSEDVRELTEKLLLLRLGLEVVDDDDRMSSSGKETLDKLASLVETDREGEQK